MPVLQLTTSPVQSPLISDLSPIETASFASMQQSYLDQGPKAILFRDSTPAKRRRKRSGRRARLSDVYHLEDNFDANYPSPATRRRPRKTRGSPYTSDTSPETSASGRMDVSRSSSSPSRNMNLEMKLNQHWFIQMTFACMLVVSAAGMLFLTNSAVPTTYYEPIRPEMHMTAAGLRGKMVQGHWDGAKKVKAHSKTHLSNTKYEKEHHHHKKKLKKEKKPRLSSETTVTATSTTLPRVILPASIHVDKPQFDKQDIALYSTVSTKKRRLVAVDPSLPLPHHRKIKLYPADVTDNTQLYPILDSSDERLSKMELREPYSKGECVPMQDWQTEFHPSCNEMHELPLSTLGVDNDMDFNLFGTNGFWRNAWKVDFEDDHDTVVLKTLKFEHNFEDAHFEHDRVDAVAMERLTSSKHVINIFGFCGHSVMTEYSDVPRIGKLVDKAKKKPLQRLRIARDIANGLADVHGIDGDNNATFVHLDINPANVVSVGGTLKLNDFNIGIIRQWNTTSNEPCGFPAQYPNPQWRSPEEARGEQNLTEKVDVFSMGHIFFRLICGHEPWNKLEPGGRPSKEEVNKKVQTGVLPFIPEDVMESTDPEVVAIREAMLDCYTVDPLQRPSARKISRTLDKTLQKLKKETIAAE
eukprot:scaffold2563_cov124-Cylindrotheca_fusiformis.AAC.25